MTTLSFEHPKTAKTVCANSTEEVIELFKTGYLLDHYTKRDLMDYIENGYTFEFYSQALEDDIFFSEIPIWLEIEKENYEKFKEFFECDHDEMQYLTDKGFSLDESFELLENSISLDDIPDWLLTRKLSVSDIIEWIEWIEKNDDGLAEAAFYLDIEPYQINDKFVGYEIDKSEYAQSYIDGMYDIPAFLYTHIDWESVGDDLLTDYTEHNGYYFNLN